MRVLAVDTSGSSWERYDMTTLEPEGPFLLGIIPSGFRKSQSDWPQLVLTDIFFLRVI